MPDSLFACDINIKNNPTVQLILILQLRFANLTLVWFASGVPREELLWPTNLCLPHFILLVGFSKSHISPNSTKGCWLQGKAPKTIFDLRTIYRYKNPPMKSVNLKANWRGWDLNSRPLEQKHLWRALTNWGIRTEKSIDNF